MAEEVYLEFSQADVLASQEKRKYRIYIYIYTH